MPTLDYNGTPFEINDDGFLVDPAVWNEDIALLLAKDQEGLDALGREHWAAIHFIREFWLEHGLAPMIRILCKRTGLKLKRIYVLFPSGPARGVCKLAGLPSADGCV